MMPCTEIVTCILTQLQELKKLFKKANSHCNKLRPEVSVNTCVMQEFKLSQILRYTRLQVLLVVTYCSVNWP